MSLYRSCVSTATVLKEVRDMSGSLISDKLLFTQPELKMDVSLVKLSLGFYN